MTKAKVGARIPPTRLPTRPPMQDAVKAAIDAILGAGRVVDVQGHKLTLVAPVASDIRAIRSLAASMREDMSDQELVAGAMDVGMQAISACLGCDDDRAMRLFVVSGGERGDLYQAALSMCGLDFQIPDSGEAAQVDDPT